MEANDVMRICKHCGRGIKPPSNEYPLWADSDKYAPGYCLENSDGHEPEDQREEEIREVEEEIRLLQSMVILLRSEPGDETAPIYKRTIARLEAVLADLKKGTR